MLLPRLVVSIFSVGLTVSAGVASGQNPSTELRTGYPNKPLRIVTAEAGGAADFLTRQIAQGLSGSWGQPLIVDNRGGGIIPGEIVSKAPPDGYTLLVLSTTFWTAPLLQTVPYDVQRDFAAVTLALSAPNIVVVNQSLPVKSVPELIALAKAKPGALNYASGPSGAPNQIAVELFNTMAGVKIVRIPYKGSAPALTDLIAGEVQLMITNAASVVQHIKAGKLKAIAVTSARPSALFPDLPTVAATLPGYEAESKIGMFAPAKTPAAIIRQVNQEIVRFLNRADVKERYLSAATETVGSSPEQFASAVKSEMATLAKLIKDAGIRAD